MSEERELQAFSDGEYIFEESEDNNTFYFYREDAKELGNVGSAPMEMYRYYMCKKAFEADSTEIVMNNVRFDRSTDDKYIRITAFTIGEKDPYEPEEEVEIEPKGIKKLVKSLFNKNKR